MNKIASRTLIVLLILLGAVNILIGVNVGFGGIETLGWQGQTRFFEITNEHGFLVQDSHMRYFGGLYSGIGLFLMLAATNLRKYRTALNLVFYLIFMGGLARLTMQRSDIIFSKDILGSIVVELAIMPVLWILLSKAVVQSSNFSLPNRQRSDAV